MELKDTTNMMLSDDYKERFKGEYFQLRIRIIDLAYMLIKYKDGTLRFTPTCPYDLLKKQLDAMNDYCAALEDRATLEGIDLGMYRLWRW